MSQIKRKLPQTGGQFKRTEGGALEPIKGKPAKAKKAPAKPAKQAEE